MCAEIHVLCIRILVRTYIYTKLGQAHLSIIVHAVEFEIILYMHMNLVVYVRMGEQIKYIYILTYVNLQGVILV